MSQRIKRLTDPHVDKHSDHIDDELILTLVKLLNREKRIPISIKDGFTYFATNLKHEDHWYKMVWLLEKDNLYVGVITAYRDRRMK